MNRAYASKLLDDDGLLGKVAVGVLMVVVELEETEAVLGAFAAQRRSAALDLDGDGGIEDSFGLGNGGQGLGRERLLRGGWGEGEEVHEGTANRREGLAAGRHGDGWVGGDVGEVAWLRCCGKFGW